MQQSRLDDSSDFQMDLYWILTGFWYHILFYIQILPHANLESRVWMTYAPHARMSMRMRLVYALTRMRMISLRDLLTSKF